MGDFGKLYLSRNEGGDAPKRKENQDHTRS